MKFKVLSFFIVPTLLLSCNKESSEGGAFRPDLGNVSLEVTLPGLSKVGLEGDSVVWEAGDSISVWDGYGVRVFRAVSGGSATAVFTGDAAESDKYYVVYPAGNCFSYATGKADVVIPQIQEARPSNLSNGSYVCYGVVEDGKAALKAIGSVMQVEVEPGNKALSEIEIKGSETDVVSGFMVVTSEPEGVEPVFIGTKNSVRLIPSAGETFIRPGKYNVTLVPTALSSGIDIIFRSEFYAPSTFHVDGLEGSLAAGKSVNAGSFSPLSGLVTEEADDNSADPVSKYGFDLASMAASRHPRLVVDAEDFIRLRHVVADAAQASSPIVSFHNAVMDYADRQVAKKDPIPEPDGSKHDVLSDVARESVARLVALSYAWQLTGQDKYLSCAKENLAVVCGFPTWYPQSYLSTGELQFAVAIAYDWLYYDLSLAERTAAHAALKTLGLGSCPEDHIAKQDNWNQVCNAGLLASALAIYEKDKAVAAAHIDKSVEVNLAALDVIYGSDGSYPEGYGYWEYGTEYQVLLTQMLLSAFGNAAGIETHKGFSNTGEYMLYMSDALGTFSYSDGGRANASVRIPMWWFAAHYGKPELLFNELPLLEKGSYMNSTYFLPFVPLYLVKHPDIDLSLSVKPSKDIWAGNGVVPMFMVHTGWTGTKADSYLAAKGGAACTNHGHMDAGTFIFDFNGVRWIDEILLTGGYASLENPIYAAGGNFWDMGQSSLRWDAFVLNNLAHPTLSFANNDGSVSGKVHDTDHYAFGKAVLTESFDTDKEKGGQFDMSPVFRGQVASASRKVVLRNGDSAVITDVITALDGQDAQLVWTAPTKTVYSVDDDCVELVSGSKEMYLTVQSSDADVTVQFTDFGARRPVGLWGWIDRDWDQNISAHSYGIMGYRATIPAGRTVTLVATISSTAPGQGEAGAENERPQM